MQLSTQEDDIKYKIGLLLQFANELSKKIAKDDIFTRYEWITKFPANLDEKTNCLVLDSPIEAYGINSSGKIKPVQIIASRRRQTPAQELQLFCSDYSEYYKYIFRKEDFEIIVSNINWD